MWYPELNTLLVNHNNIKLNTTKNKTCSESMLMILNQLVHGENQSLFKYISIGLNLCIIHSVILIQWHWYLRTQTTYVSYGIQTTNIAFHDKEILAQHTEVYLNLMNLIYTIKCCHKMATFLGILIMYISKFTWEDFFCEYEVDCMFYLCHRYGDAVSWKCFPDSKVHGANMGPTWVLSAPDGPHVGPMNLAI